MLPRLVFGLSQGQVVWEEEGEGYSCLVSRRKKGPRQSSLARSFMCKPDPSETLLRATLIPHFLLPPGRGAGQLVGVLLLISCETHIPLQDPGVACLQTPGWNNNEWEALLPASSSALGMLCWEGLVLLSQHFLPPCLSSQALLLVSLTRAGLLVKRIC